MENALMGGRGGSRRRGWGLEIIHYHQPIHISVWYLTKWTQTGPSRVPLQSTRLLRSLWDDGKKGRRDWLCFMKVPYPSLMYTSTHFIWLRWAWFKRPGFVYWGLQMKYAYKEWNARGRLLPYLIICQSFFQLHGTSTLCYTSQDKESENAVIS